MSSSEEPDPIAGNPLPVRDVGGPGYKAFDPLALLQALGKENVEFIVIGGVAARTHGSPTSTVDLDICYERSQPNLERLAQALRDLHATLRGVDSSLPFQLDAKTLRMGDHFTFSTDAGDLDCLGIPSGTNGFLELRQRAEMFDLGGESVWVTSLDDLIRMKHAAGRLKDQVEVLILEALRDELQYEDQSS